MTRHSDNVIWDGLATIPNIINMHKMNNIINAQDKYILYPVPCPNGFTPFNEDWYINEKGCLMNARTEYHIHAEELGMNHWMCHLMQKRWFDANTFIPAYFEACRRYGITTVEMCITH